MTRANDFPAGPLDDALPDDKSVTLARAYIERHGQDADGRRILHHWREEFYRWDGRIYVRIPESQFHADVYHFLKTLTVCKRFGAAGKAKVKPVPFQPEPRQRKAVVETLETELHIHVERMPHWLDPLGRPDPRAVIAFKNGLLDVNRWIRDPHTLPLPSTPTWFSTTVIPHDFRGAAHCPVWDALLESSLGGDRQRIGLLQEWAGLLLVRDTSFQKMLWLVGVPGSGKGTIIRQLQRIVGEDNVANPSMAEMARGFGLESLLGKTAVMIPDAHIGNREDPGSILDIILAITGEDSVNVSRKWLKPLTNVRLDTRFTIGVNKLPKMPDASNAIARRMLIIPFDKSFDGQQDRTLEAKLAAETSGIVAWALCGLTRLRERGTFTEVEAAKPLLNQFKRLNSPIWAFIGDRCVAGPEESVTVDQMFDAYKNWRGENGHPPISKVSMGMELRATGLLRVHKEGPRASQYRVYKGLRLTNPGESGEQDDEEGGDDETAVNDLF